MITEYRTIASSNHEIIVDYSVFVAEGNFLFLFVEVDHVAEGHKSFFGKETGPCFPPQCFIKGEDVVLKLIYTWRGRIRFINKDNFRINALLPKRRGSSVFIVSADIESLI